MIDILIASANKGHRLTGEVIRKFQTMEIGHVHDAAKNAETVEAIAKTLNNMTARAFGNSYVACQTVCKLEATNGNVHSRPFYHYRSP